MECCCCWGGARGAAAQERSAEACPATLERARKACGCQPREAAAFNLLAQTKINSENLRSQVSRCFQFDGSLKVSKLKAQGQVDLNGCLSKVEQQYPEYRQVLAELVRASFSVPDRELDSWLGCYARELGQGRSTGSGKPAPSSRAAPRKPSPSPAPVPAVGSRIEQDVSAENGGSVKTKDVEATTEGGGTIRQKVEAQGHGSVVETGHIKAHIGR